MWVPYHQYLDAKWAGHSSAFTRMKEGYVAPLEKIAHNLEQDALVVPNDDHSWQVWCDAAGKWSMKYGVQSQTKMLIAPASNQ